MLFSSLILLASAPPLIETVPCKDCPPPAPEKVIAPLHLEPATEIYQPYFRCYSDKLSANPEFGSKESAKARATLVAAREGCATLRISADTEMDRMLASKEIYGDGRAIEALRETFRQRGGVIFMYMTASANGVRDKYLATMSAATGIGDK